MVAPLSEFVKSLLPGKDIANDGDPIVVNTSDGGGAIRTLIDAAITEADGFYDGALIYFAGDTTTVALRGVFEHVRTWLNSTKTFTFAKDLPAIPAAGDTYSIIFGGNKRSSQEAFGLLGGGVQPELAGIVGSNITGLTITKFAGKLGEGVLTIDWDDTADDLTIKIDSEPFGSPFNVVGDSTDTYIYADDGVSFIKCDIVNASLPASDQVDTHTLTRPNQTLTPDYEGYETLSDDGGKTRYRLEVLRNEDPVNAIVSSSVFTGKPVGASTFLAAASADITLAQSNIEVDDATGWPTKAFWIFLDDTVSVVDCRYCLRRSGNFLTLAPVEWLTIPFDNGNNEPAYNAILDNDTSGGTAVIDQVFVTSGSFAGNDAAGTFLVKKVVGTWTNNDVLSVAATFIADISATTVFGLRGKDAVSWSQGGGEVISLMSDIDIGLEVPSGGDQYDDPSVETIAPVGVTFTLEDDSGSPLALGALAINAHVGIWRREWILDGSESRVDINLDTNFAWS